MHHWLPEISEFCILLGWCRSGEWGDHITLQAAADKVGRSFVSLFSHFLLYFGYYFLKHFWGGNEKFVGNPVHWLANALCNLSLALDHCRVCTLHLRIIFFLISMVQFLSLRNYYRWCMFFPYAVCSKDLPLDLFQRYVLYRDRASTWGTKAWYESSFKLYNPVHAIIRIYKIWSCRKRKIFRATVSWIEPILTGLRLKNCQLHS